MNRHSLTVLLALALVAGCTPSRPPPKQAAAKTAEKAAAEPDVKPVSAPDQEFVYSGAGKRDPFRSYLAELARETNTFSSKCSGPLGRYELEQMKLVAVITGLEDPVAMVELPNGDGFVIRRNSCIGKNGGVVAAVRTGEVIVTEWRVRADGSRDPIQTPMQLPKPPPLTPEE